MEIETTKKNEYTAPYVDTRIASDVTENVSLADYYPEVRRVIFVTARAIPEGKFISGNDVDCDGIIAFNVTYLGEDGTIVSVPISTQYTQSASLPEAEGTPGELICISTVQNPTCRVTSARTLSLKAHVMTRIYSVQNMKSTLNIVDENGTPLSAEAAVNVEENCTEIPTVRMLYGAYSGEIEGTLDSIECDRVIAADGMINIIEARAEVAKVSVRAEAVITLLLQDKDGIYKNKQIKVPFEADVPMEEAATGDSAVASALVTSVEVVMNDDGLSYVVEYDMDAQVTKTESVRICLDAFSTEYESAAEFKTITVLSPVRFINSHLTQTGELKRHGEAKPGEYVIGTTATAEASDIVLGDGNLKLSGNISVQTAISQDDEIVTEEGKIPFSYETDASYKAGTPVHSAIIDIVNVTARIDGATIIITAELSIDLSAVCSETFQTVSKLTVNTSSAQEKDSGIKICFPEKDESVWEICKKYGCSRRTVEKINGWKEGQISAGTLPIIIE